MNEKFREILRLTSVRQIGQGPVIKLLNKYKTADECKGLSDAELKSFGLCKTAVNDLRHHRFDDSLYYSQIESLSSIKKAGLVTIFDDSYPANLRNIYDPPAYLFYQGSLSQKDDISIAIVGSRTLSSSGKYCIQRISRELASAGFVIISGLAMGADTIAHYGALEAGKRTVAVLGSGIDVEVNVSSRSARRKIIEQDGAVMSPFLIGTSPTNYTFPARNRIISGISLGVLVGEAKKGSGSLITANFGLEQGKEVFALPNEIYREKFEGSNNLIMTGQAKLVAGPDDIINEMPERVLNMVSCAAKKLENRIIEFDDEIEKKIYDILIENSRSIDELIEETLLDTGTIMSKLFMLEMKKLISREANNIFSISRK